MVAAFSQAEKSLYHEPGGGRRLAEQLPVSQIAAHLVGLMLVQVASSECPIETLVKQLLQTAAQTEGLLSGQEP